MKTRVLFVWLLIMLSASACASNPRRLVPVVSPSSLPTSESELSDKVAEALDGDMTATNYLILYYTLEAQDDVQAYRWMLAAAVAGECQWRREILLTLAKNGDGLSRGSIEYFSHRWGLSESNGFSCPKT